MAQFDESLLRNMESAASVLLASPDLVTPQQRNEAETVFMRFRKTKDPFALCRHILETSCSDYLKFEASSVLREALLREWSHLPPDTRNSLQSYLLRFLVESHGRTAPQFVRTCIMHIVAIAVKRGCSEDNGQTRKQLIGELEQMLANKEDNHLRVVSCGLLAALLQELATTVKSSQVGLTWDSHLQAKRQFEAADLLRVFKMVIHSLSELAANGLPQSSEGFSFLARLMDLAESVLSWGFVSVSLPKHLISIIEAGHNQTLRPGPSWREVLLQPQLVDLFFQLYWLLRKDPRLAQVAINCLVQLATLNGAVLATKEHRLQYLNTYMERLLKLMTNINVQEQESLGVASIIRKLLLFFPPSLVASLPAPLPQLFLEQMSHFACSLLSMTASEDHDEYDESWHGEALNHVLEGWLLLIQDGQLFPKETCRTAAAQVLNAFLCAHLTPPDGTRKLKMEEVADLDEDDRVAFRDRLETLGALGRQVPEHSLQLLARLLHTRTLQLQKVLEVAAVQGATEQLASLYEDLHWLLLVAGCLLAMDNAGETALIPTEIMQHSMRQASASRDVVAASVRFVESRNWDAEEKDVDDIIRLVTSILRLAQVHWEAAEAGLMSILSPEVERSLLWFLRRWTLCYLMPCESYYSEVSITLLATFGKDSQNAVAVIDFLLRKIGTTLRLASSEVGVIADAVALLLALVESKEKSAAVLHSQELPPLLSSIQNPELGDGRRGLMKGLVVVVSASHSTDVKEEYLKRLIDPLKNRFGSILSTETISRDVHNESVRAELCLLLDAFIGATQGSHASTASMIFKYIFPIMRECSSLIGFVRNYAVEVQLVLELFTECSQWMLCYLCADDCIKMYECCLQVLQAYANTQISRISLEVGAEEESFKDILLVMELLSHLLSKDMIDLSGSSSQSDNLTNAADVSLYGLNIIMPLMNRELLRFPALATQYFKMVVLVCELYPRKVCTLPDSLLTPLLQSVALGLTASYGSESIGHCCDLIRLMSQYLAVVPELRHYPVTEALRPFLKVLMDLLLLDEVNSDVIPSMGAALFGLIVCFEASYREIVEGLLARQTDPTVAQRLAQAFNALTDGYELKISRFSKTCFRDNFEVFIASVRGLLIMK